MKYIQKTFNDLEEMFYTCYNVYTLDRKLGGQKI